MSQRTHSRSRAAGGRIVELASGIWSARPALPPRSGRSAHSTRLTHSTRSTRSTRPTRDARSVRSGRVPRWTRSALSATWTRLVSLLRLIPPFKKGSRRRRTQEPRPPASPEARKRRVTVGVAAAFALVVLFFSFPFSTLISQHRELSAAAAQLAQARQENQQLAKQEKQLSSKAEIERRARQDYQLVEPGQTLYNLLPGPGNVASSGGSSTETTAGDPGNQPLVSPSQAPDTAPDPGLPATPVAPARSGGSAAGRSGGRLSSGGVSQLPPSPSSFWSRVGDTLEFWK